VITLRPVEIADIDVFYGHQSDPVAAAMAATTARDYDSHRELWTTRILVNPDGIVRTVLVDGSVAGNILSWLDDGKRELGYRFGREYWGRGIATEAVGLFLAAVAERPIYADVAVHNVGSRRVLEKNGFAFTGSEIADDGVELLQFILRDEERDGKGPTAA
jgi:RimJ/RimL family protein N-acetyltransferase